MAATALLDELRERLGRRISVKLLARDECDGGDSPLLREVHRSGVAA
jgi:hypothetical protein